MQAQAVGALSALAVNNRAIGDAIASCLIIGTMYLVTSEARRIRTRFFLQDDEAISFSELARVFPGADSPGSGGGAAEKRTPGTPGPKSA